MYIIESRNILTPQNGLNVYRGRTENSILLTEVPGGEPMDIGVKKDAPELLSVALKNRRSKGMILMGNLGDPYNELEDKLSLTRECLKVIENNDHGVILSTKRKLIMRDVDVLKGISAKTKCVVDIPLATLDDAKLSKLDGEETLSAKERLELIRELRREGIDVLVTMYPIIPFVNDEEAEITELVQCLAEYDILGVDLMDLRLAVKKSVRSFFYIEFRTRFPEEYKKFCQEYTESGELPARNQKLMLKKFAQFCEDKGLLNDTRRIKAWKRQYENKTVGKQLSILDML